ncbi:MAG: NADH-quinone oxidoreductase subunit J [Thermodesulfobacteriota bacterium]
MIEQLFFYAFAIVAVISAVCVVSVRSAVHSAFFLIICLLQVAAIFVLLRFPFLAAVQVFIYVGAVMVLFLFAVMVLDIGRETFGQRLHSQSIPSLIALAVLFVVMGMLMFAGKVTRAPFDEAALAKNTEIIGRALYTKYIYPFEVVSVLLLIALIGAVVLVMRDRVRVK